MNKTLASAMLLMLLAGGCAAPQQAIAPDPKLELISMTELPPLSSPAIGFGVKLVALFQVRPDGTTKDVTLVRPSGVPEWDRPAIDSMKQWRFTPLATGEQQVDRWLRHAVIVQVQDPVVMRLAEMVVPTQHMADSLFALLEGGADFDALGRRASKESEGGFLKQAEAVNIARYPSHVRNTLSLLRPDQVSRPIRIGLNYVIFKRYHLDN